MFNICWRCGAYRPDKRIDPSGPIAVCPECGHAHPFKQLPLLVVGGASGAGKSAVCRALFGRLDSAVLLDADILWSAQAAADLPAYYDTWLRLCKNIAQAGRPVVLCGAGIGVPANLEPGVERRYFSTIHYLALVCTPNVLAERLRQRPAWRGSAEPGFIAEQQRFNQWFLDYRGDPPITRFDTTTTPLADTVFQVAAWITARLPS